MRYVLDCSVAVRWFVPQTHWQVAAAKLDLTLHLADYPVS